MSVQTTSRVAGPFAGNGVTTVFPFTFKVFTTADLLILYTDALGNNTTLTLGSDYSITLNSNQDTSPGGTITYPVGSGSFPSGTTPLAVGASLTGTSQVAATQGLVLTNNGGFFADNLNTAFDKLTILVQQVLTTIISSLTFPISDGYTSGVILPTKIVRANGGAGSYLFFSGVDGSAGVATGVTSNVAVSAAMTPVVQSATVQIAAKLLLNGNINSAAAAYSDTNVLSQMTASANGYVQKIIQNTNAGTTASADIVVSNNSGTATTFYGNFGMNSSGFTGSGSFNKASAVYLTGTSGDLVVGTTTANAIHFVYNGGTTDNATIDANGLQVPNPTGASATQVANIGTLYGYSQGFVNKFRNPSMDVAQRSASGTNTTAGAHTVDGWIVTPTGASITWNQVYGTTIDNSVSNLLQVTGNTSVTNVNIYQNIESKVAAPLQSQTVTVSALIYNNTGSSFTPLLTVNYANVSDNFGALTAVVNAISLQSCPAGVWTRVAYTFVDTAHASNGYQVLFNLGNNFSTSGKSIYFTKADIRVTPSTTAGLNSNPPYPESRPIGFELAFCQRYYAKTFPQGTAPAQNIGLSGALTTNGAATNQQFSTTWQLPVTMRTTPSVTTYAPDSLTANWSNQAGFVPTAAVQNQGDRSVVITGNTSVLAGGNYGIHATASAEL